MVNKEFGSQEQDKRFSFPTEDSLLTVVRTRLQSSPELLEKTKGYFSKEIVAAKDEIIGVRCEDVVTFLAHLTQERIPVGLPEWATYPIRSKSPANYHLTTITNNPFYDSPEFKAETISYWLTEEKLYRKKHYPQSSNSRFYFETNFLTMSEHAGPTALATVFTRTLPELLRPDWRERAMVMGASFERIHYEEEMDDGEKLMMFERFISLLHEQLDEACDLDLTANQLLSAEGRREFPKVIGTIYNLFKREAPKAELAEFLLNVVRERNGVMVGFNQNILQSEVDYVDSSEIVIRPEGGFIDLSQNQIVAIEPLGDYEDRVLKELGII